MFAANAYVQVLSCTLAQFNGHIHKLADAVCVKTGKRIAFVDLAAVVRRKELACVVTAEAEGHLSQVVGTEAEELGLFCDFVRSKACTDRKSVV